MKTNLIYVLLTLVLLFSCKSRKLNIQMEASQKKVPVLVGKEANEVLKIRVINGNNVPIRVKKLTVLSQGNTNLKDIENVNIYYTGKKEKFSSDSLFSKSMFPAKRFDFEGDQLVQKDTSYFWVSYKLKETANLLNNIDASCESMVTSIGRVDAIYDSTVMKISQKIGVAVRQSGNDNVHTYRIPGLTTTNEGTLLAVYDVRRESGRDLQGNMDIGLSRSVDGGQNWEPMRIVMDMKTWGGLPEKFNGVSDASILVDKTNNDIYIAGLWMHGVINADGEWIKDLKENDWNHQWRNKGSQPGLGVRQTSQFLIIKSSDDGKTWSEPINLTTMCKDPKWWLWAPAPGHGITLKDGTLVFPTQGRDENGLPFSNITYSKDGGKTWKTSTKAYTNTTESMAVELSDGSIMLNMRDNRNAKEKGPKNGRAIAVTYDLGETWQEHVTSHNALIESVCMASIHRHDYKDENGIQKSVLLFSNPNSKYRRHKQTIKVSFDDGLTWPEKYWIELDVEEGFGYSCLTSLDEKTIGILYEGSQAQMTFQKISLNEILKME